jgi:hypothetical protein
VILTLADQHVVGFLETGTLAAKLLTIFFYACGERWVGRLGLTGGIIYTNTVVKRNVRLKHTLIAIVLASVLVAVSASACLTSTNNSTSSGGAVLTALPAEDFALFCARN